MGEGGIAEGPLGRLRGPASSLLRRGRSPSGRTLETLRRFAVVALVGLLALSLYGTLVPSGVRCALPGGVDCAGGLLGPDVAAVGSGNQWFDVTMYDWGFWIVDTTTGANESGAWNVFEGWTVHVNATSLPPNKAIGGTAYHGLGVEINATGQQLLSVAAPVGKWTPASFVAPNSPYYHQHIWCTIPCGPGHGSQQEHILNIVPAINYPAAQASANITQGPAPLSVQFTGNASSGAPPYNLSWSFGDGSPSAYGTSVQHTFTLGGVYYARLTVTDSKGNPGSTTVTVTVLSSAPLRSSLAASPASGVAPLGSSFSTVAHGGTPPYNYTWSFGDGVNVTGLNATQHVYASPGVYAAEVTVVDAVGASCRALAEVTVRPSTGTFSLTTSATPANGSAPFPTTLNVSASGGTAPYRFTWDFGDGTTAEGASVAHTYNTTGSYEAAVFASDAANRTAFALVHVDVTVLNTSGGGGGGGDDVPAIGQAVSGPSATSGLTLRVRTTPAEGGAPLTVNASVSIEGGSGTSESVNWSFGDGGTATGQVVSHAFAQPGRYTLSVTASDSGANAGSTSAVVNVGPAVMQVVANETVGDSPFSVTVATTITGGSGSYGPVTWDWGDGLSGSGDLAAHTYGPNVSGPVTVTARSSDATGTSLTASLNLTVSQGPVARLLVTQEGSGGPPVPVSFSLSVSGGSGGYASVVLWTFGDQSSTRGPTNVTHTYNLTGHYLVTVTTNDSSGRLAVAQAWVNLTNLPALAGGGGQAPWIFTGVSDPGTAALGLLGLVAATGLAFLLRRKRSARKARPPGAPRGSGPRGHPTPRPPSGNA